MLPTLVEVLRENAVSYPSLDFMSRIIYHCRRNFRLSLNTVSIFKKYLPLYVLYVYSINNIIHRISNTRANGNARNPIQHVVFINYAQKKRMRLFENYFISGF